MDITLQTEQAWTIFSAKLIGWAGGAVALVPNLIVASFVMLGFWIVARVVSNLTKRLLSHTSESATVTRLVVTSVKMLVLFFGLFTTLGILNLDKTVTSLLAGAGVLGLAVGFAFQEIAANFFSGILIALRKPYQEGDIVKVDSYIGTVTAVTLRTTNLRTFDGLQILVPNKDMFTKPVTNYTHTPDRRVELDVGVSYDADLKKVETLVRDAVAGIAGRLPNRNTEFYYTQFADSSINFQVRFWVEFAKQPDFLQARHDAIVSIKEIFDANAISIPFPIRTLDLGAYADKLKLG